MDGSPQLLTDVKFKQLKRGGYDPDQVDNFLERVSAAVSQLQDKLRQATERAEAADAQIAEARRLQAEAEALAAQALADGGGGSPGSSGATSADAELTKVLVLAQRAADQAVDEANSTATRTVADARAKAVNLLAEAEQERDRMLAKARKKADAAAEERAHELQKQVTELEAVRVDLQSDVDLLQGHLDGERARLRGQLDAIALVLDHPHGLVVTDVPTLHNTPIPDFGDEPETPAEAIPLGAAETTGAGDAVADLQEGPAADLDDGGPSSAAPAAPVSSGPSPWSVPRADESSDAAAVADPPTDGDATEAAATDADLPAPPDDAGHSSDSETVLSIGTEAGGRDDEHEGDTTIDLTSKRLFGAEVSGIDDGDIDEGAPAGAGSPTERYTPPGADTAPEPKVKAGDSPLGEPDAAADAAMRAFFEQDLDEAPDSAKTRFGRRR